MPLRAPTARPYARTCCQVRSLYTILGNARCAERALDQDIAAAGPERDTDCVGENADPAQHLIAGFEREFDVLGRHRLPRHSASTHFAVASTATIAAREARIIFVRQVYRPSPERARRMR